MITIIKNIYFDETRYIEARGLSTDNKPTDDICNGSMYIEMDSGKVYFFDAAGETWREF